MREIYVQYGCGLSAPEGWLNFDASPTLRLQKLPVIGYVFKKKVAFPKNVLYGDILSSLPGVSENSCQGIYCSHVLEHLSLNDFRIALRNTYKLLKRGGMFRCVLPDLEASIVQYSQDVQTNPVEASINFLNSSMLGIKSRPRGLKGLAVAFWGNSHHLWMWDKYSLANELKKAGFVNVGQCQFNDSVNPMFRLVEDESRFIGAVAFEAVKP